MRRLKALNVRNRKHFFFGSVGMSDAHQRPPAQFLLIEQIGKALRTANVFRHGPLPEAWIELIKRLDAEEEAARAKGKRRLR